MQILPYLPPVNAAAVQPMRTSLHPDTFKPTKPTPGILPGGCWIPPSPDSPAVQARAGVTTIAPIDRGGILNPPITILPVPAPGDPVILPTEPIEPITIQLPHPDSPIQ